MTMTNNRAKTPLVWWSRGCMTPLTKVQILVCTYLDVVNLIVVCIFSWCRGQKLYFI
uniref:Uncharacterized protein n=1 Tax=Arundo donax TaxID=35708 RepID=A0A0A9HB69_ARUDO